MNNGRNNLTVDGLKIILLIYCNLRQAMDEQSGFAEKNAIHSKVGSRM